ncbi:hypothetical protein CR513_33334, partial [Mucuna pruriens]
MISHESRDEAEGASWRKEKRIVARHAAKPVHWVEERSHSCQSNKVVTTSLDLSYQSFVYYSSPGQADL